MVLVCLVILIFTYQKYFISQIIINWFTTMFVTMVPIIDDTMMIHPSKYKSGEIKKNETM